MCGIWGYFGEHPLSCEEFLRGFNHLKHRGPDDSLIVCNGEYYSCSLSAPSTKRKYPPLNQDGNFFLGFHRLSIVDTSEKAMQPFSSLDANVFFAMVGEVYNYQSLKNKFLPHHTFHSRSDAEVAFRLYLLMGNDFIHELEGMYTIVIYHKNSQNLKIFSDRLRQKPFFFLQKKDAIYFASEMTPIITCVPQNVHMEHLAHSCYLGTSFAPNTPFQNISSLQPGEMITFSLASRQFKQFRYWSVPTHREIHSSKKPNISSKSLDNATEELFQAILPIHTTGDVPQAVMLSGGTDSGLLAYYLKRSLPDLQAITLGNPKTSIDAKIAQCSAQKINIPQHFVSIPKILTLDQLDEYLLAEEEPNFSIEPQTLVSAYAQSHGIKVLFSGVGPDEVFFGYRYHLLVQKYFHLNGKVKDWYALLLLLKSKEKFDILRKWGAFALPFLNRALHSWKFIKAFFHLPHDALHPLHYLEERMKSLYPDWEKLNAIEKIQLTDIEYYIGSHHTFRTDQAGMRYGVEVRLPYLNHQWIVNALELSKKISRQESGSKQILKKLAKDKLPTEVIKAQKYGFSTPLKEMISINVWHTMKKYINTKHVSLNHVWHIYAMKKWMEKYI